MEKNKENFNKKGEQIKMLSNIQKAHRKIKQLIDRAKQERDRKGYRENLGYDSQGILEDFLETLNLSYPDKARLIELFYRECDQI